MESPQEKKSWVELVDTDSPVSIKKEIKDVNTPAPVKICPLWGTNCKFGKKCTHVAKKGNDSCPQFGNKCHFLKEGSCFHKESESEYNDDGFKHCHFGSECKHHPANWKAIYGKHSHEMSFSEYNKTFEAMVQHLREYDH